MTKFSKFDRKLREKILKDSPALPEQAWEGMEGLLDEVQPQSFFQKHQRPLSYSFAVILTLSLVGLLWMFSGSKKHMAKESTSNPFETSSITNLEEETIPSNAKTISNPLQSSKHIYSSDLNQPFLAKLNSRMLEYQTYAAPEKTYVHTDRNNYHPGNDMWFKVYVRSSKDFSLSKNSEIAYVELLDKNKEVIFYRRLILDNGVASGDFHLPKDLSTGAYTLKAYTNWQQNFDAHFTKEIWVTNAKNLIPQVDLRTIKAIDLQFLPEGGQLVADLPANVAFKAIDQRGENATVKGYIINSKKEKITTFDTYHDGMGAFQLIPQPNESYKAIITNPILAKNEFDLPKAWSEGLTLQLDNLEETVSFTIRNQNISSAFFAITASDQLIASEKIEFNGKEHRVSYETKNLPTGIARATLFSNTGKPMAERQFFVHRNGQIDVQLKTNKTNYLPHDQVKVDVEIKDHNDRPIVGDFSLAVLNESYKKALNHTQGNIRTSLLLDQDLKGDIHNPSFYFESDKNKQIKPSIALDLLMLTHGWSRFSWEEVLEQETLDFAFSPETKTIRGWVFNADDQALVGAEVGIYKDDELLTNTDSVGQFILKEVDLSKPQFLTIQFEGHTNYIQLKQYSDSLQIQFETYGVYAMDQSNYLHAYNNPKGMVELINNEPKRLINEETILVENAHIKPVVTPTIFEERREKLLIKPGQGNDPDEYLYFNKKNISEQSLLSWKEIPDQYHTVKRVYFESEGNASYQIRQQNSEIIEANPSFVKMTWGGFEEGYEIAKAYEKYIEKKDSKRALNLLINTSKEQNNLIPIDPLYETVVQKEIESGYTSDIVWMDAEYMDIQPYLSPKSNQGGPALPSFTNTKVLTKPGYTTYKIKEPTYRLIRHQVEVQSKGLIQMKALPVFEEVPVETTLEEFNDYALQNANIYYKGRSFYSPKYKKENATSLAYRPTVFWNPTLKTNKEGKASTQFTANEEIGIFEIELEGIGNEGKLISATTTFEVRNAFSANLEMPATLFKGEDLMLPLQINNNENRENQFKIKWPSNTQFEVAENFVNEVTLEAKTSKIVYVPLHIKSGKGQGKLKLSIVSKTHEEVIEKEVQFAQRGYPVNQVFAARNGKTQFDIDVHAPIENSLSAKIQVYSAFEFELNQLLAQVEDKHYTLEGTLLNIYLLKSMSQQCGKTHALCNKENPWFLKRLLFLQNQLIKFQDENGSMNPGKSNQADLVYTAITYWLMNELNGIIPVNKQLLGGSQNWLVNNKITTGGWKKELSEKLKLEEEILLINILSKTPFASFISNDIEKLKTSDQLIHQIAVSNHLVFEEGKVGADLLTKLLKENKEEIVEENQTLSLSLMLQSCANIRKFSNNANQFAELLTQKKNHLGFGKTTTTILALEALADFYENYKGNPKVTFDYFIDGKKIGQKTKDKGKEVLVIDNIQNWFTPGLHQVEIVPEKNNPFIVYELSLNYQSRFPEGNTFCNIKMQTALEKNNIAQGEKIMYQVSLENTTNQEVGNHVAVLGLPFGIKINEKAFNQLMDKGVIENYEINANSIMLYFNNLPENKTRKLQFEALAELPGTYIAPPSFVFTHDQLNCRNWSKPEMVFVE